MESVAVEVVETMGDLLLVAVVVVEAARDRTEPWEPAYCRRNTLPVQLD